MTANDSEDGSEDRPFSSLKAATAHIIAGNRIVTKAVVHPGVYKGFSLDHPSLSGVLWRGVPSDDGSLPIVSGGIEVPMERFQPWPGRDGVLVASLTGLGITDLGKMVTGNCVADCQHDQVGITFGGEAMTLARWPNIGQDGTWQWANADADIFPVYSGFTMDLAHTPDAERMLQWAEEKQAFVHGYWGADWCDGYARITEVTERNGVVHVRYDGQGECQPSARWMGVNLLCELDQPGEYFVDTDELSLYFYPPEPLTSSKPIMLMHQPGAVVNITSEVTNAKLENLDIRDGRHLGVDARNTRYAQIQNVVVHGHGTHGIDATNSRNTVIGNTEVFDVGCSGIRAVGGEAKTLEAGDILVESNKVHSFAQWKRSYQPGIYWGGVMNVYRENTVQFSPHNCFLGGGNFEDGVLCRFEGNLMSDCVAESVDSGAFYSCGQGGNAFINRGNVLVGNTFRNILKRDGSSVITQGSVQAVYLDDQMSGWQILNNTYEDCHVANFIGGGRDVIVTGNNFVRCGTIQYLNNQGMTFDKDAAVCSEVGPPGFGDGETQCSTGAAKWMASSSPAAEDFARIWPEMTDIANDHPGWPAYSKISENTYCQCPEFISSNVSPQDLDDWLMDVSDNTEKYDCSSLVV